MHPNKLYRRMLSKVIHILVSLVLFASTTGLTVDKHYCGGDLVSVSFLGHAKSCSDMDGSCCKQDTDTYRLTVDFTSQVFNFSFDQAKDLIPDQVPVFISLPGTVHSSLDRFGTGPPPIPFKTLPVLQRYRL